MSVFGSMKEQMKPEKSVEAALHYRLETEKKKEAGYIVIRWIPAMLSVFVAFLLVFNLAMPASAEQIPLVGKVFESLNDAGRRARAEGKTPDFLMSSKKKEDTFGVSLSFAECNGLDLVFRVEIEDTEGLITDKSEVLTIVNSAVELEGNVIYPTDESPRLTKTAEGIYSGWASFNASAVAALLPHGTDVEATLYCDGLNSYVEGATYEEVTSLYTYGFTYAENFSVSTDLSDLEIEYLDMEKDGVRVEYLLKNGDRTDIVYSVDENVEYAKSYSLFCDIGEPRLISSMSAKDQNGRYVYNAVFVDKYTENSILPDEENSEISDDIYRGEGDIILYSHATGDYMIFESEEEAE